MKVFEREGGQVLDLETCDNDRMPKFESGSRHLVLAEASPSQSLRPIFGGCSARFTMEDLQFYSVEWIPDSVKAKKILSLEQYLLKPKNKEGQKKDKEEFPEERKAKTKRPDDFVNSAYACFRPSPLAHKNIELVAQLEKIARHRYLTGNSRSELSYNKAIAVLKSYTKPVESEEEAEELAGIGPKITGLIGEFIKTGRIRAAEGLAEDEEAKTLDLLTRIHGVGPRTAQTWYQLGIRSLDGLGDAVRGGDIELKEDQMVGLQYYKDFDKSMSRAEVEEIYEIVKEAAKRIFQDAVVVEMTGGYRRGKERNGDADILLHSTGPSPTKSEVLDKLITALRPKHVKAILTLSKTTLPKSRTKKEKETLDICFMAFQTAPGTCMRRVDFIVTSPKAYPFAMLGWTGSRQFERSIRLYAHKEHGMTLSDHSLVGRRGEEYEFGSEREIFEFLGVPYLEPYYRNC